ncbi:MAG: transporter substrate-binding domain-containing protein [Pseudomonadota bacterium]
MIFRPVSAFQHCAVLLGVSLALPAAAEPLRVVADEWPPFSGAALPGGGISLDVISTVLERAGYEVAPEVLPWARIMDGAQRGDYDIVGSLFLDADIQTYMTYSEPFYNTDVRFVRKTGSDAVYSDLAGLEAYSIAVGDGFLYEPAFDRSERLNKVVVTTTMQGLQMVAHGRVDMTLDSLDVLRHSIQSSGDELAGMLEILPGVLTTHGVHMAVHNDVPGKDEIVADFNRVLAEMRTDGSLSALLRQHVGP